LQNSRKIVASKRFLGKMPFQNNQNKAFYCTKHYIVCNKIQLSAKNIFLFGEKDVSLPRKRKN